jgi:hypothetical protein
VLFVLLWRWEQAILAPPLLPPGLLLRLLYSHLSPRQSL